MSVVVFSLKSHHAKRVYCGSKRAEFRRATVRAAPGDLALVYETRPVGLVTGFFVIEGVVVVSAQSLHQFEDDDLERRCIERYLNGAKRPVALLIGQPRRFRRPFDLHRLGIERPPQSYQFLQRSYTHPFLHEAKEPIWGILPS